MITIGLLMAHHMPYDPPWYIWAVFWGEIGYSLLKSAAGEFNRKG